MSDLTFELAAPADDLELRQMLGYTGILIFTYLLSSYIYQVITDNEVFFDSLALFVLVAIGFFTAIASFIMTRQIEGLNQQQRIQEATLRTLAHELRTPLASLRMFWGAVNAQKARIELDAIRARKPDSTPIEETMSDAELVDVLVAAVAELTTDQARELGDAVAARLGHPALRVVE